MPECTNPVQCQTAKRIECTCGCGGANHSILRKLLDNPETQADGEEQLAGLRTQQSKLKKVKRVQRRQKRAEARKAETLVSGIA